MAINKFVRTLLCFNYLRVVRVYFPSERALEITVKPYKNGRRCPHCGRSCRLVKSLPEMRWWRDIPVAGRTIWIGYRPREVYCPTHGRVQEEIPWAAPFARVTYRFEYLMLRYCQMMTQKAASELLHLPKSSLSDILHRVISQVREGHQITNLRHVGVDEISYCRGRKFATIVYDLERSCVVWVGKGKGRETIDRFFREHLSQFQRDQIVLASCDMGETYIGAIREFCPNAVLVLDRFHVVKALNNAVDEVRKEQWRQANTDERKFLKGVRWILYRHSANRSAKDADTLKALDRSNHRIYRASQLKDEFEQFWEFRSTEDAEVYIRRWMTRTMRSRLEPLKKFVRTIRKHFSNVLSFIGSPITNAIAEGLNRVIKIVKNRASGFQNLEAFTDMIYLTVGDIDIPAQIPVGYHII